jgi:hypothetical protein
VAARSNAASGAGVAGGASSGKSTVCKMIIDQLRDQRVVVVTQVGALLLWLYLLHRPLISCHIHVHCILVILVQHY